MIGAATRGALIVLLAVVGAAAAPAQAPADELVYEHAAVVPFSFRYPRDWAIRQYAVENPAFHWLVASPDPDALLRVAPGDLPVSLRVTVIGHEPVLLAAPDVAARAREIVIARFVRRDDRGAARRLVLEETVALGAVEAELSRVTSGDATRPGDGYVLHAVIGTTLLVAELDWRRPELAEVWREAGLRTLRSFRSPVDPGGDRQRSFTGGRQANAQQVVAHLFTPRGWSLTPLRSDDESKAYRLSSPRGFELVIRTAPVAAAEGTRPTLAALRSFLLATGLVAEGGMKAAQVLDLPGGAPALRILAVERRADGELIAFTRGGAHFACVLKSGSALLGHDWGRALAAIAGLEGPRPDAPADPWRVAGEVFACGLEVGGAQGSPFDRDGRLVGHRTRRLRFDEDGRCVEIADRGPWRAGRYRLDGDRLQATFEDGAVLALIVDRERDGLVEPSAGEALHRLPALR